MELTHSSFDNNPCGIFSQSDMCDYLARSFAHDTGINLI